MREGLLHCFVEALDEYRRLRWMPLPFLRLAAYTTITDFF